MQTRSPLARLHSNRTIVWLAVAALAALYGAFTLSWVIYRVHLPQLTTQFGFSPATAPTLLLIEALLTIALEPLMGRLSDYYEQKRRGRLRLVTTGIVITAGLFVIVPLLGWVIAPTNPLRWLLPVLLIGWAIALTLVRSPALAYLKQYVSQSRQLPFAAGLLTFAAGLTGAFAPLAGEVIKAMGTIPTWMGAALLLLLAIAALRISHSPIRSATNSDLLSPSPSPSSLGLLFCIGLGTALAFRLVVELLPKIFVAQILGIRPPVFVGLIFLSMAIAALPLGKWAVRFGNRKAMLLGLAGMAIGISLMTVIHSPIMAMIVAIVIGVSFSLVSNGMVALALSLMSSRHSGMGVGMIFGGGAAASSLWMGVLAPTINAISGFWIGILALLTAGICIALLRRG